ncbi:amino-acid N-acetyltransferase [Actinomadura atramentaria]|uniref:amino-acid N-acetyltransferase n=1 Tax=Actinomadura atramentaria TaxID=1990 RepID=UPI0003759EEF
MEVVIRRARTADVQHIRRLIDLFTGTGRRLLRKSTVTLYEDVQEFWIAEDRQTNEIIGCGALHVMWEDLAEVRSVAVAPGHTGRGIGHRIVTRLLSTARDLGVRRVFCLTFEVEFFARHGFRPILGTPVAPEVYEELLRSYDEGVAEFLDLDRVKPNTLGNTRMLLRLED